MVKVPMKVETYDCGGGFHVDVTTERGKHAAWIYYQGYGVKEFMFGVPEEQCSRGEFLALVEDNYETFARQYASVNLGADCSPTVVEEQEENGND